MKMQLAIKDLLRYFYTEIYKKHSIYIFAFSLFQKDLLVKLPHLMFLKTFNFFH